MEAKNDNERQSEKRWMSLTQEEWERARRFELSKPGMTEELLDGILDWDLYYVGMKNYHGKLILPEEQ